MNEYQKKREEAILKKREEIIFESWVLLDLVKCYVKELIEDKQ